MIDEEKLYDIKSKTVPLEQSNYGRSPLFKKTYTPPKLYSTVEVIQQQQIYRENYHNPKISALMQSSLEVLKKLKESEKNRPTS